MEEDKEEDGNVDESPVNRFLGRWFVPLEDPRDKLSVACCSCCCSIVSIACRSFSASATLKTCTVPLELDAANMDASILNDNEKIVQVDVPR